jgi:ABC-type lipoprotein export system ATPase subunit
VLINVKDLPNGTEWLAIIGYNRWAFEVSANGGNGCGGEGGKGGLAFCLFHSHSAYHSHLSSSFLTSFLLLLLPNQALAINEFRDRPYSCGSAVNPGTCVTNGDQILMLYTYDQGSIGFCLLWMVVICLVIHCLAYLNLWHNATAYLKMRTPVAAPVSVPVLGEAAAANGTSLTVRVIPPSKEEEEEALEEVNERGGGRNMAPVPAVNVSWQNVTLKVRGGKARPPKVVLDDVSGEVRTGTLTAIMGPTGSGKSSLLMVLAGRVVQAKGMELTGTLLTNKIPRDPASFRSISAFVTQDDLLFGHLSVSETLVLAAHFALGSSITPAEKAKLVASIVDEMALAKTLHTIIGDDRARGVSGGERKRVSIGVELISNPSVLFLDEPTSGDRRGGREGGMELCVCVGVVFDLSLGVCVVPYDDAKVNDFPSRLLTHTSPSFFPPIPFQASTPSKHKASWPL